MDNFDVYEWNKTRYLERITESTAYLEDLADKLSDAFPHLRFDVRFPDSEHSRIDVYGSQQDLYDFGSKYQGQQYQGYEIFHTDDDDRGEIVRIVKQKDIKEKEDDEFAGSDPKAGSTIQGTGFNWTKKDSIKETVKFIKENNPEFTTEEIAAELKEIKMLGSQLQEESKLCKRGQDYIAARKRAGEKSSAYLSGRGVKVCKGQIKFKGKKQKDFKG